MNDRIDSLAARNWLERTGFKYVEEDQIKTFFATPNQASHMFIAMLCIANCAETPQQLNEVYFNVRFWAESLDPSQELHFPRSPMSIETEVENAKVSQ